MRVQSRLWKHSTQDYGMRLADHEAAALYHFLIALKKPKDAAHLVLYTRLIDEIDRTHHFSS